LQSEVARIRQQIADEYQSAQFLFSSFTPTAKHEMLNKRQENLAAHFEQLKQHIGPQEAMKVLIELGEQYSN
jgi:hypothetical protein